MDHGWHNWSEAIPMTSRGTAAGIGKSKIPMIKGTDQMSSCLFVAD